MPAIFMEGRMPFLLEDKGADTFFLRIWHKEAEEFVESYGQIRFLYQPPEDSLAKEIAKFRENHPELAITAISPEYYGGRVLGYIVSCCKIPEIFEKMEESFPMTLE